MSVELRERNFAVEVVQQLRDAGYQALWAGGCVRDLLRGSPPKDYDIATDAEPADVRRVFGKNRTLAVGASFGVIVVRAPKGLSPVEVATFRTEGPYLDGRRPEHVQFSTAEEDAKRRDFTINGMFYDPVDEHVLDYVGGKQDLEANLIRAIGAPSERMQEDKLRMLRAVRFAATLGFDLDEHTAHAVEAMAHEITVVSAERIAQELRRMIVHVDRRRAVELIRTLGLLPHVLPELQALAESEPRWTHTLTVLDALEAPSFELAMTALWHDAGPTAGRPAETEFAEQATRRLRLSNIQREKISWLLGNQQSLSDAANLPASRLKRLLVHPHVLELLDLMLAQAIARNEPASAVTFCRDYFENTPPEVLCPAPLIDGNDLLNTGLEPGPHIKTVLETVRDAQLNGEIDSREAALELAARQRE